MTPPRWLRRARTSRAWRRTTRRFRLVHSVALSLLLAIGLVGGRIGGAAEPVALSPVVVASPLRLRPVVVSEPAAPEPSALALVEKALASPLVKGAKPLTLRPHVPKLPAPQVKEWRLGMGRAPVGHPVEVSLTAYCLKGLTRRDNYVREGIVAADPRLFPMARYLEIYIGKKYFGRFLIDDTGGAIKGNKIDIWTPTCRDAVLFGRRKGTAVLVSNGIETCVADPCTVAAELKKAGVGFVAHVIGFDVADPTAKA